jgi:hypothetical protein
MGMSRIKIAILILLIMAFISGCTLVLGIMAASDDEPISLIITVESNPSGADVYLNEKKLGTAPLTITIEGLSREHKIVFIKSGYETKIERVSISPGRQLDEKYLSVIKPDGTSLQVGDSTLNVALEKEVITP